MKKLLTIFAFSVAAPAFAESCVNDYCTSGRAYTWTPQQAFLAPTLQKPETVASLGTCVSGQKGAFASVYDGDAGLAIGQTVVNSGAGATYYKVTCDGSAWVVESSQNAITQSASDNSTKVATTAFFVAQLGQPHTWSALQTFGSEIHFNYAGAAILGNLYYDGNFRYYANGFGTQLSYNNSTGGVAIYAAPSNSGGAGALATPAPIFNLSQTGALQLPTYTTAGVLTNDASGNVTTTVGVTDSGASCTIIAITKGVITDASCTK